MKKVIGSTCLAALLSMGMTTGAAAQTEAPQTQENTETKGDDSGKYGLAGLLGLLGLAGLKRNRHDAHRESVHSGAHWRNMERTHKLEMAQALQGLFISRAK